MALQHEFAALIGAAYTLTGDDVARWSKDWTGHYTGAPGLVLRPGTTQEVSQILSLANTHGQPITPVSGLTGLVGGCYAPGGVMLSLDRLNRVHDINPTTRTATVDAGVVLADLHAAAEAQGMIFPLTFGAKGSAMIGGAMATNAGGSNVLRYGNTRDLVLGLEAVLADGRVVNLMSSLHKDNSGLNLRHLLIGSEGTLAVITKAVVKLAPKPTAYATAMVGMAALDDAITLLHRLQDATGGLVEAFEFMPQAYMDVYQARTPGARAPFDAAHEVNIMIELGATAPRDATPDADGAFPLTELLQSTLADMMEDGLITDAVVAQNDAQRTEMWDRREAAAEITFWRHPIIDMDVALPLDRLSSFLTTANARVTQQDAEAEPFYIAHLGDGNVHYAIYPSTDDPALKDALIETVEDVVADMGGSFSAEHGVGLSKRATLQRRKDPVALALMRQIKSTLDPNGILNPGKMLPD